MGPVVGVGFPRYLSFLDKEKSVLLITLGATDVGATYANQLIAKLAIKKRNHLRPCLGWVVWKGSVARCYALATRPNHGEAHKGATIHCTP